MRQPAGFGIDEDALGRLETLRDLMRWGASCFTAADLTCGHGFASPLDEAVYLALHAVRLPPDTHPDWFSARLLPAERTAILALYHQRIEARIPVAYLTREAWFAGLPFHVDERVLIPRSPIAELVEQHFSPWVDGDRIDTVLDLCTGSGCIGIACAYAFPRTRVDLVDISFAALEVARQNIERHDLKDRVRVIRSDLFKCLEGARYDLIVSNPPYVDAEDMRAMDCEYAHEPVLGLAAGSDGLSVAIPLLEQAADHLNSGGLLVVEVGNSAHALSEYFSFYPFTWIEFERGGLGVFALTREQLLASRERGSRT